MKLRQVLNFVPIFARRGAKPPERQNAPVRSAAAHSCQRMETRGVSFARKLVANVISIAFPKVWRGRKHSASAQIRLIRLLSWNEIDGFATSVERKRRVNCAGQCGGTLQRWITSFRSRQAARIPTKMSPVPTALAIWKRAMRYLQDRSTGSAAGCTSGWGASHSLAPAGRTPRLAQTLRNREFATGGQIAESRRFPSN